MNLPPPKNIVHLLVQHNRCVLKYKACLSLAMAGILISVYSTVDPTKQIYPSNQNLIGWYDSPQKYNIFQS